MSYTTSSNMGLIIPTVGSEAGPLYASDINNSLKLVDAHNHSPGMGVQIQPSGLNINGPLTFQTNPVTNLGYAAFTLQTTAPSVVQSLYVLNGSESTPRPDLWYYDGSTAIQITSGGTVNALIASLPGESYSAGTFTWKQGSGSTNPANFDIGSVTIRPNVATTTYGTLIAPATGLAGTNTFTLPSVNMTMPTGLPLSLGVLTMDTSGNVVANPPDNVTITFNSGKLEVATGGITSTQIANQTITQGLLAARATGSTVGAGGVATSSSCGAYVGPAYPSGETLAAVTNLSVTITTTGRPVMLMLMTDGSPSGSNLQAYGSGSSYPLVQLSYAFFRGTTNLGITQLVVEPNGYNYILTEMCWPVSSATQIDPVAAGTYTYTFQVACGGGIGQLAKVNYAVLCAYEI